MNNTCELCGKPCQRRWCSQACNAASRRSGEQRNCTHCGGEFYARPADTKKGGGVYCSMSCRRTHKAMNAVNYHKIGRKAVHRIVVEQKLGRPLGEGEVVHHVDGDKHNNAPDNLIVLPSQSAHMQLEVAEGRRTIDHDVAVQLGRLSGEARRKKKAVINPET